MAKRRKKGAKEARNRRPRLLDDAISVRVTVITRLARSVTAPGSLKMGGGSTKQRSLLDLEGSGRGLRGRNSSKTLTKLRDEWNR
jgi:hypothetical protein